MKSKKKKDREYMAILDRPIEELKKPMGQPIDFGAVMNDILHYNPKKKKMITCLLPLAVLTLSLGHPIW